MKIKIFYLMELSLNGISIIIENNKNLSFMVLLFINDFLIRLRRNDFFEVIIDKPLKKTYFLVKNKNNLSYFKKLFNKVFKEGTRGSYLQLEIRGRNYKFFFESGYLIVFLGFCHYVYVPLPKNILILSIFNKNTRLYLYSFKRSILFNFKYFLQRLYKKDVYKGKGIFFSKEFLKLKEGKKKEFF